jgi:hypothetical protein
MMQQGWSIDSNWHRSKQKSWPLLGAKFDAIFDSEDQFTLDLSVGHYNL